MNVTMKLLAQKSGYSKSTISRALNDDPRVKDETKEKIKALAKKYNYQPHMIASNLAKRQTKTIGLLFPRSPRTISDPFFMEFFNGVSDTSFEQGYSLLIPRCKEDDLGPVIEQLVRPSRVDGLILTEPRINDSRIKLLKKVGVPFVFLGSTVDVDVPWVDGDNENGAYRITKHLIDSGHTSIGVLTGERDLVATQKRFLGFQRALQEAGLRVEQTYRIEADFTRLGAYQAVKEFLRKNGLPFTALFASNDLMAIGAIQAFRESRISVPGDISVAGFDGIEMTKFVDPSLTTVQQPIFDLGRAVTKQLLKLIQGGELDNPQVQLPVEVVVRGSTQKIKNPNKKHVN